MHNYFSILPMPQNGSSWFLKRALVLVALEKVTRFTVPIDLTGLQKHQDQTPLVGPGNRCGVDTLEDFVLVQVTLVQVVHIIVSRMYCMQQNKLLHGRRFSVDSGCVTREVPQIRTREPLT